MSKSLILPALFASTLILATMSGPRNDAGLDATLWVQTSAEWQGLARQAYNGAGLLLDAVAADPESLAALEQAADPEAGTKPPALIVDIDETVLDNSPYQARLLLDGESYDETTWDAWVKEAKASPVPGSLAFLNRAASRGIRIFYVSNRKAHLEEATRRNLEAFGFPLARDIDCVLLRDEKEDWGKDKASRRRHVAADHRIVMLIGDDLGDFISSARTDLSTRAAMVAELGHRFGRDWFLVPGPTYGSWHDALLGFSRDLKDEQKLELKRKQLDPRRKK